MSSPRAAARSHYLWSLVEPAELDDTLILAEGEGVHVKTVEGDRYLDLMSTVSRASSLGYSQERIARAVYEQLGRLHYGGCGASQADVTIELAARLAELAPGDLSAVAFTGSGSEANEVAFKLARLHHQARGVKPRAYKVIARSLRVPRRRRRGDGGKRLAGRAQALRAGHPRLLPRAGAHLLPVAVLRRGRGAGRAVRRTCSSARYSSRGRSSCRPSSSSRSCRPTGCRSRRPDT